MIYKILLSIVLLIVYLGLFWGLPIKEDNTLYEYLFSVGKFHVIFSICAGIAILITWLIYKTLE